MNGIVRNEMRVLLNAPCQGCKAPVQVVRRPLQIYGRVRNGPGTGGGNKGWVEGYAESTMFSVVAVLDADGEHACARRAVA